jgi:hypothetical protein
VLDVAALIEEVLAPGETRLLASALEGESDVRRVGRA